MINTIFGYGEKVGDEFHKYIHVGDPFLPEIAILGRLRGHSNIIELKEHSCDEKYYKLVFPFYNTNMKNLSELEIVKCIADISGALAYCHRNKVLHRDVKPNNIVRGENFKLIDFSNSVIMDTCHYANPGMTTYIYESPECARGKKISVLHDMWSFGITILELYTGGHLHELFGVKITDVDNPNKVRKIYSSLFKRDILKCIPVPCQRLGIFIVETISDCLKINQDERIRAKTLHRRAVSFLAENGITCEYKGNTIPVVYGNFNDNNDIIIACIEKICDVISINFSKELIIRTAAKYTFDVNDAMYHCIIILHLQFEESFCEDGLLCEILEEPHGKLCGKIYDTYVKYSDQYDSILIWE